MSRGKVGPAVLVTGCQFRVKFHLSGRFRVTRPIHPVKNSNNHYRTINPKIYRVMKNTIAHLVAMGVLGLPAIQAQSIQFTFTDGSVPEGDAASVFVGDIIGGQVDIDTTSGNYTVTWVANPDMVFMGPLQFILNLGNAGLGDVVSLSQDYEGYDLMETYSYSGNEPALMDWMPGDIIVTSGTVEEYGVAFDSGIFSLFPDVGSLLGTDLLNHAGVLEGDSPPPPSDPPVDSDGDGILDEEDPFPNSDLGPTVILLGEDSGVPNVFIGTGTTLADAVQSMEQAAAAEAKNHGDYVQTLAKAMKLLERDGWIDGRQRAKLLRVIARALD
jgi:hypothetical protein